MLLLLAPLAQALCCTTAVVSAGASADGRPLLWKQRDASDPFNIMARVSGGRYSYTGLFAVKDTLRRSCYGGINEAGFALINNLSYNLRPDSLGFDVSNGAFMARALASCRSVEDFERMLAAEPAPRNLSANFGVADALGAAAYFEAGDSTFVRFDVPDGDILFRTNYSLSGDPERGRGRERYLTMDYLTEPPGLFSPEFFFKTGRSYLKNGRDALSGARGRLEEHDFIPRSTTVSGIVIECPVRERERGLIWCATGYTPCCYAVAVVEGEELPGVVQGPANEVSRRLYDRVHDGKMVDAKALRRIIRGVERFERREMRAARRLMRRGLTPGAGSEAVRSYNASADRRFRRFVLRTDGF